jgi:hypothetical protein
MHSRTTSLVAVLLLAAAGCSSDPGTGGSGAPPEVTEVRASVVDGHEVVVTHRSGDDPWSEPERVLTLDDRECGAAEATTSGGRVAVTVECDDAWYADQAPTRSVALIGEVGSDWDHHDLDGEAYGVPAVSPSGRHAVWSQGGSVLRWSEPDGFEKVEAPSAQALAVADDGVIRTADLVGGADGGVAVRITEGSDSQDVDLPSGSAESDVVYDAVAFRGADRVVVRSDLSTGDVVVRREDGRWAVQE